jgi:hypothetical protein
LRLWLGFPRTPSVMRAISGEMRRGNWINP